MTTPITREKREKRLDSLILFKIYFSELLDGAWLRYVSTTNLFHAE